MRLIFILLLGAILCSSTFSPQYLIWVAPFVAFLNPLESGMFIFSSFLTWFYFRYWNDIINLSPVASTILLTRNLILLSLIIINLIILIKNIKDNGQYKSLHTKRQ